MMMVLFIISKMKIIVMKIKLRILRVHAMLLVYQYTIH